MENKDKPLSPHLQVYRWHISSLLSIAHRIVGVINFIGFIFISSVLLFSSFNSQIFQIISQSFFGKFLIISLCWSFSFQIVNEIRHLAWDIGYGFDLKVSQITGIISIIASFVLAILLYLQEGILFRMIRATTKWLTIKISSGLLIPFLIWFVISFVTLFDGNNSQLTLFFSSILTKILFSLFTILAFTFYTLTISEVFEDYISDIKFKNAANRLLVLFSIVMTLLIIIYLIKL